MQLRAEPLGPEGGVERPDRLDLREREGSIAELRFRDERPRAQPDHRLENAQHPVAIGTVDHDRREIGWACLRRPPTDELVVPVAVPERLAHPIRGVVEDRLEPVLVGHRHPGLDLLLPLRGKQLDQRSERDGDVDLPDAQIADHPAHGCVVGVREALAADDHAALASAPDLANEREPAPDRRGLAVRIRRCPFGHGMGGLHWLSLRPGVADALRRELGTVRVEGALDRGRAGLVWTDVQQSRSCR